ncbi:ferredoxin--NADP reductase [Cryomorphaceae bacterium]|nr:ferredoxin--NADP reductase [Cryomorphaceae bacterium]
MDFLSLKVTDVHRETADAVSISFKIPLFRKKDFRYRAGQYLTIKAVIDGQEVRRNYSFSSSPGEKKWTITVKEMPDGTMSRFLNREVSVGDTLLVHPPEGRFTLETRPDLARKVVLVGAGSGITPLMSHLKTLLKEEPKTEVLLLYGNRSVSDIIFKEELDGMEEHYDAFKVVHFLSRDRQPQNCKHWEEGRISRDNLYDVVKKHLGFPGHPVVPVYLLCGPGEMIEDLQEYLYEILVPRLNVHSEFFTAAAPAPGVSTAEAVDCRATVILNGEEHSISIPAGTTVLDAVTDAGLDAPYSCTSGICATCIAKQTEGEFDTSKNISLGQSDIEEGFILTCSTTCSSSTARIDYDDA